MKFDFSIIQRQLDAVTDSAKKNAEHRGLGIYDGAWAALERDVELRHALVLLIGGAVIDEVNEASKPLTFADLEIGESFRWEEPGFEGLRMKVGESQYTHFNSGSMNYVNRIDKTGLQNVVRQNNSGEDL